MRALPMAETPSIQRWLTLIGIGEDGPAGVGDEAKRLIASAPVVFGGARHIELMQPLITGEAHIWLSPFEKSVEAVLARRGTPIVVLASGDPFFYGVGATLSRRIPASEMSVIPAPSSFSLAASRLGWPLQDVTILSLHGRPIDLIRPHLHPGRKILTLTSDSKGPAELVNLLQTIGFGQSTLTVLEALGGPQEKVSQKKAADFAPADINDLNICGIEVKADANARILPVIAGLADELFEHDGQITKREIRAMTLSALAPRRGELLWDVGAGSGSIGIEWMLADPSLRAIAIEASGERAARIRRNAGNFGVPGLTIIEGEAPGALAGLPTPDAIFIGGGGSDAGVLDAAISQLRSGGRLVANAVTTEMEAALLAEQARRGGSLTRIDIARAAPVGRMTGWRPAMPVTQWCWIKP
ncbi:precorrin-6y C5,15-methyltransferase (decarboxylating) subunit CbiE [Rhizobium lusitanum]|uniref:precorrin-6y C5,15-methyltransferase (decarboxylating) subunit CbiE n=1 Tax=Rhizobium lusitanum TaxID=293958 RepID=UPI00195BFB95|nr:precorrin-6y C5,15-methyltransferase (decarboxylating) subunit CbiE [Rhizobium lusitanum]MBM7046808.1 precorrin-6y C5,15-methyltransferase (decarboxylating) subunit CbiE [Rhizobium lusitanum]